MKDKKNFNNISVERKRIRWSTLSKTSKAFITTLIFLVLFSTLVIFFSWAANNLLDWIN